MKIYQALAKAFHRELSGPCFALLGDANMHWAGAMAEYGGNFIYTRHEHAAVAGATAFARAADLVGCASVTCGPGLTQVMTILPIAVRARIPLVLFAGEAPLRKAWYNQAIDQKPFVEACGAVYRPLHDPATVVAETHQAFATAKSQRITIVLGVPFDLQQDVYPGPTDHPNSAKLWQPPSPVEPEPDAIMRAADWIGGCERPIVLAGLGAIRANAKSECVALAEQTGAMLATTLPAKGYFNDQAYCLGVAGGFATERAKAIFAQADLVIAIGARLAAHTFDAGKLTPDARVVHVDVEPQEWVQGRLAADLLVRSDARLGAGALCKALPKREGWRTAAVKNQTRQALELPDEKAPADGWLHPMAVVKRLAQIIPPECHVVNTSGHSAYYTAHMNQHPHDRYTVIREFGAIGNGTSFALGVAAGHPDRPVILIDGDGSALMHIQELETMKRHGLNVLVMVLNDGAYGSEVHKLRADGLPVTGSVFGRPDFAAIGRGFGLAGKRIETLDGLENGLDEFLSNGGPMVLDVPISDQIASPQILRAHRAAHP